MLYYIQTVAIKKHFVFSFSIQTFNKDDLALSETKKKTVEHMNKLLPHHTINMGKRSHNHLCTSKTVWSMFLPGWPKNLELGRWEQNRCERGMS